MIAFTQTDLHSSHVVARRIAATLKNAMLPPHSTQNSIIANVTLATLKNGDTLDSLLARVTAGQMVAAE